MNGPDLFKTDFKALARTLTLVENDLSGASEILKNLSINKHIPVIGITGPPGAGKSTLVNALLETLSSDNKLIAVLAVDPTSPFNFGSLLGDRIRMNTQYNKPNIFIRSMASRGSLGGLSAKTMEMTDVLKAYGFDYIFVETVGVGQSEVEIAGLADVTVVVLVPESGDEVQNMKSGLMEIADIFVVNKSDRPNADDFASNLIKTVHNYAKPIPVIKTIANKHEGIREVIMAISTRFINNHPKTNQLLLKRALKIIQQKRMSDIDMLKLNTDINKSYSDVNFNLYSFVDQWLETSKNS